MMKFKLSLLFSLLVILNIRAEEKELPQTAVILAFDSKLVFDLPAGTTNNGASIGLWKYNKGENQVWRIIKHDKGYTISSTFSRQVLTASIKDSTVAQQPYTNDELQYWDIVEEEDAYKLMNKATKLYISLNENQSGPLSLSANHRDNNQKWYIIDSNYGNSLKNLIYGSYIDMLKSSGDYDNTSKYADISFTYQSSNDSNLLALRNKYKLDSIAGTGSDILKILNVMHWLHNYVPHNGSNGTSKIKNAIEMIKYGKKNNQGINCRGLAMTLNECYLALGFKSRYVTCLPKDSLGIDSDCHVINSVYSTSLEKWIWVDPSFDAYVMDDKGELLSIEEVRERIINDKPLILNPEANWNNISSQTKDHYLYHYMAKNLYTLQCPIHSRYNSETKENGKEIEYIYLHTNKYSKTLESKEYTDAGTKTIYYRTINANAFWEHE